jgi:hypothetical protein
VNGFDHFVFRDLLTEAFDHDDLTRIGRDDHIEIGIFQLGVRRKRDQLAIDATNTRRSDRALERQRANEQRASGSVHSQDVGIVLHIAANDRGLDLDFIEEAIREERSNRPIHQTTGERFFGRWTTFTLQESAGEFPSGKKSVPGREGPVAAAVKTTVSPYWVSTQADACLANWPVSKESTESPICFSTRYFTLYIPTSIKVTKPIRERYRAQVQ